LSPRGARPGREQGVERGHLAGLADAVLRVLEARGFVVPDELRSQVGSCQDASTLERWLSRAAVASSLDEVFS